MSISAAAITASASIVVAVLAFVLNQHGQVRQERRRARLERVNSQLQDLYGPLNALVSVNEQIWERLRETTLPSQGERSPSGATPEWIEWRDVALMPANKKMRDLIVGHADLLLGSSFPRVLEDFCAHVASLEVIGSAESSEVQNRATLIKHPGSEYVDYVRGSYALLKTEQQHLLRLTLRP